MKDIGSDPSRDIAWDHFTRAVREIASGAKSRDDLFSKTIANQFLLEAARLMIADKNLDSWCSELMNALDELKKEYVGYVEMLVKAEREE